MAGSVKVERGKGVGLASFQPFGVAPALKGEPHIGPLRELAACFGAIAPNDPMTVDFASLFEAAVRRAVVGDRLQTASVPLASGATFQVDLEDRFAALLWAGRLTESGDLNIFCRLAKPGALVVDVGANFGLYAVEAGRLVGGEASVVAFEPTPRQFALLEKNITSNGLARAVIAIRKAVASKPGTADFFVAESNSFSGLRDTGRSAPSDKIAVELTSLDEESALAGRPVDLLKIDVEGSELDVLAGAEALLVRSPEIVILFEATAKNQTANDQRDLVRWIEARMSQGWALYCGMHGADPGLRIDNVDAIAARMHGNFFLVREEARAHHALVDAIAMERQNSASAQSGSGVADAARFFARMLRSEISATDELKRQLQKIRNSTDTERKEFLRLQDRFDEEHVRLAHEFARLASGLEDRDARLKTLSTELSTVRMEAEKIEASLRSDFKYLSAQLQSVLHEKAKLAAANEAQFVELHERLEAHAVRERELRSAYDAISRAHSTAFGRLTAIENSRWWRLGSQTIFPLLRPFRRRT